jgi:hypothetical protein
MSMTFADMQTECLEHQLNDTKYRPSVKRWLNDAQARVCRQASIRTEQVTQTYSTTSGTNTLALPATYARKIDLRNTTDQDLLNLLEMREYDDLSASSGKPLWYIIIGANIELYPNPDATYPLTLRFWRLPATLTADTDTPEIPGDWHFILPYWALYRCFSRENDIEQASYWKNEWLTELEKLKGELQYEGQDAPRQQPGDFDDGPLFSGNQWY